MILAQRSTKESSKNSNQIKKMSSIVTALSSDDRVFQIENSAKAVGTVTGVKYKDGNDSGASKSSNKRSRSVHRHSGMMVNRYWITLYLVLSYLFKVLDASAGDADPLYRACIGQCEKTGCVGERCFPHCKFSSDGVSTDGPWYMQEPLYLQWKIWDCQSDCRYNCMVDREKERAALGDGPVKYHGKWPFKRVYGIQVCCLSTLYLNLIFLSELFIFIALSWVYISASCLFNQEPASVAFSAVNFAMHFHGWLSFFTLLYYRLPLKPNRKAYYEFSSLWHIYALLSMNSWFWSAIFHSRDVDLTEKIDYSSAVALLGYSLILAILRCFNVRDEASRVMAAAPLLAFVTTHILYLNCYKLDYGWNMKVCGVMGVAQLLIWAVWAGVSQHPSRWKLWTVVFGGGLAMLLEIYDFPPYYGFLDAHALWHAATIPLTYVWWSFIKDDAEFQTSNLLNKVK